MAVTQALAVGKTWLCWPSGAYNVGEGCGGCKRPPNPSVMLARGPLTTLSHPPTHLCTRGVHGTPVLPRVSQPEWNQYQCPVAWLRAVRGHPHPAGPVFTLHTSHFTLHSSGFSARPGVIVESHRCGLRVGYIPDPSLPHVAS
jgi:hypothetical protein